MPSFLYSIGGQFYLVYLGLFIWRKPAGHATGLQVFSYYSENQDTSLMKALTIAALMEMGAAHILFLKLAPHIAPVVLALSIATLLQIFGCLVSWRDNPIIIEKNTIKVCWGIFRRYSLSPDQIVSVKAGVVDVPQSRPKNHMFNTILAEPNVTINLKPGCLYKGRTPIDQISLAMDAPKAFVDAIHEVLVGTKN